MSETAGMIADIVERLLDMDTVRTANAQLLNGEQPAIWDELDEIGIGRMMLPEEDGGAACTCQDLGEVVMALARTGAPLSLPEEAAARALCRRFGLPQPEGRVTFAAPSDAVRWDGSCATGSLRRVPWGRHATALLTIAGDRPLLVDVRDAAWRQDSNLAHEPRDGIDLAGLTAKVGDSIPRAARLLLQVGALVRAAQMAGAAERATELTLGYAGERKQFGRPLAAFQAIQQQLARMAEETLAAAVATRAAFAAAESDEAETWAAIAKVRAGDSGRVVAEIAHQVHGAMGFTLEHHLRFFTQRLAAWRQEFGSGDHWAAAIWNETAAAPGPLWNRLMAVGAAVTIAEEA